MSSCSRTTLSNTGTFAHVILRDFALGGGILDLGAQHITSGDVHNAVFFNDLLGLRALATSRAANDDDALGRSRMSGLLVVVQQRSSTNKRRGGNGARAQKSTASQHWTVTNDFAVRADVSDPA